MAVGMESGLLSRSMRALGYRIAELLNVCAAYLGIAMLVTLVMVFTIAPLRSQLSQIHHSLIMALRPDSVDNVLYALLEAGDEENRGVLESLLIISAVPAPAAPPPAAAGGATPAAEEAANFTRLLRTSIEGGGVEGVTPAQERALRSYLARKYRIASSVAGVIISTAFILAREMQLDPQLILAVIAIESRYNPYAESHVGAQGLMQVMTRVHKDKFAEFADGTIAALNPIANMKVGTTILRDCIKRRGSTEGGLACYVGATGPGDGGYGAKVLAERRRIALASGIPVGR
ncbi:lytic transglycosylase domain-containing protein [Alcaligenaceae bacterium]|nr:lytic transglycosylase domain-containing protein [Alcaligenaceae bacterium]